MTERPSTTAPKHPVTFYDGIGILNELTVRGVLIVRALQQRVPQSFLLYPRKTTICLLVSTNQTRNGILYYDMEAIWKRAQHNWKCHIEKILPPEFCRLTFPSMKQDWLHGFEDRLIAQKGPPRRTLLISKMGSKMSRLPIWVTFANIYVSQRQMPRLQKLTI